MKMRMLLALVVGKLLYFLGKPFGKATNLPGEIALKLCPDLLGRLHFKGKVLAVTGSNGKTTTANMVAHVLKESGCSVIQQRQGLQSCWEAWPSSCWAAPTSTALFRRTMWCWRWTSGSAA